MDSNISKKITSEASKWANRNLQNLFRGPYWGNSKKAPQEKGSLIKRLPSKRLLNKIKAPHKMFWFSKHSLDIHKFPKVSEIIPKAECQNTTTMILICINNRINPVDYSFYSFFPFQLIYQKLSIWYEVFHKQIFQPIRNSKKVTYVSHSRYCISLVQIIVFQSHINASWGTSTFGLLWVCEI